MKLRVSKPRYSIKRYYNNVMTNGILIGCHHGLNDRDLNYITKNFEYFIEKIQR